MFLIEFVAFKSIVLISPFLVFFKIRIFVVVALIIDGIKMSKVVGQVKAIAAF